MIITRKCVCAHRILDVDISRRNLFTLLTSLRNRLHIPNTQRSAPQPSPHIDPSIVLMRSSPIRLSLYPSHQRSREVHLPRMRESELHYRADFGVNRWALLLLVAGGTGLFGWGRRSRLLCVMIGILLPTKFIHRAPSTAGSRTTWFPPTSACI